MSPYGPVTDSNCPPDNPYCNCPSKLFSAAPLGFPNPSDLELAILKNASTECSLIQSKLGLDWFGIDYSDPYSPYNCICFNPPSTETPPEFKPAPQIPDNWKKYIEIKQEGGSDETDPGQGSCENGACCSSIGDGCFNSTRERCEGQGTWYECEDCESFSCPESAPASSSLTTQTTEPTTTSKIVAYKNSTNVSNETNRLFFNYDNRLTFDGDRSFPLPSSEILVPGEDRVCDLPLIGPYFKYYKEYSKTSATFWNTPPMTPLYRKAQTSLITAQRIKVLVNGSLGVKPGNIVIIDSPNFGGRWMVQRVQRILTAQKHSMYLYLMRDGVA
jgi:hypothetical protein